MSKNGKETTRMTLTLPIKSKVAIDALAENMGISASSAAQHLITIGMTAEAIAVGGGKVLAEFPDGDTRVLADGNGNYTHRTPLLS